MALFILIGFGMSTKTHLVDKVPFMNKVATVRSAGSLRNVSCLNICSFKVFNVLFPRLLTSMCVRGVTNVGRTHLKSHFIREATQGQLLS